MVIKKKIAVEENPAEMPEGAPEATPEGAAAAAEADSDTDPVKALEEKLAAAEAEAKENHDRMLRLAAELDNLRKRSARELDDLRKYATENLIRELLGVVDNLERAIASAGQEAQNGQSLVDGVSLILTEITKILERQAVAPIAALGQPFDPAYHQAMCQEASADHPPNTVIQEYLKGYLIHDRLLRPAMVVVSKAIPEGRATDKNVDTNA